jgi:hypothetical protein
MARTEGIRIKKFKALKDVTLGYTFGDALVKNNETPGTSCFTFSNRAKSRLGAVFSHFIFMKGMPYEQYHLPQVRSCC